MGNKIGKRYAISTEEFCAMDYNDNKKFLLKEVRPDVHEEINMMWDRAIKIEEINAIYPETFINNSKSDIFSKNGLPEIIPVEVIKQCKNNCSICKELINNKNKYIIPNGLLVNEFGLMDMVGLDLFINAYGVNDIGICLDMFSQELNPPRKVKKKIRKDTK